ncbi:MAG: DUF5320 family protein [Candidatus Cloacimonas sp.]|nr:DUF5320 family protein [Candidatus Cloacimonas sp.]
MPNQNGTGPFGDGRLGRGLGPCGRGGRGMGCGRGFGRRGWMQSAVQNNDAVYPYDKNELQEEKSRLEKLLTWVSARLTDLDK